MKKIKQIKLIISNTLKIYSILLLFYKANASDLVNKRYESFINNWTYYNEYKSGLFDSGELIINNCSNDICDLKIDTVSTKMRLCNVEGKVKIIDKNTAIAVTKNVKNNKEECNTKIIITPNNSVLDLKLENIDGKCNIMDSASCGLNGYILHDFSASSYNLGKIYNPSFKCKNLTLISDILVCKFRYLQESDLKMNNLYSIILKKYKNNKEIINNIKNRQKDWNNKKKLITETKELKDIYIKQIKYLDCLDKIGKYEYCSEAWTL